MKLSSAQAAACLLLFSQPFASGLTYWVDQSCRNTQARQNAFNAAIREAINIANRGSQRLASNTDTNMKDNIDKIFRANWNQDQNVRNQVTGMTLIEISIITADLSLLRRVRCARHTERSQSMDRDSKSAAIQCPNLL